MKPDLKWRKSSRSGAQAGGNCVEVAADGSVYVRDSKNPESGHLCVSAASWTVFLSTLR